MVSDGIAGRKAPRTKTGCWTCRERKVRCDEQKPTCSNCVRLGLDCAGYGARITFRDDTPRVISRMEPVTDLEGCAVYEEPLPVTQPTSGLLRAGLQYRTYTPAYFEKHKDIETETELLDTSLNGHQSPTSFQISPPDSGPQPSHRQHPSFSSRHSSCAAESNGGHRLGWSSMASPQRSPRTEAQGHLSYSNGHVPTLYGFSTITSDTSAGTQAQHRQMTHSRAELPPNIVVPERQHYSTHPSYETSPIGSYSSRGTMDPHYSPLTAYETRNGVNLAVPQPRSRRPTLTSENSEQRGREVPAQKWAEHYGRARPPASASSVGDMEPTECIATMVTPRELSVFVNNLEPASKDPREDEKYLDHYFVKLVSQLNYPDFGPNNPFRLLLTSLCPRESALMHAALAFAAADLSNNGPRVDAHSATAHSQLHYDAAEDLLCKQLEDVRHEQSTAALATVYLLNLTDVKHARPITNIETLQRIVRARANAGRVYEGGICWTWYNATLGVLSAMFGGPRLVMPYLIENELLPTPGQGNMFPFIKKTEDQRIEHTIVSPIYALQLKLWVIISKLTCLTGADMTQSPADQWSQINSLKVELESTWENRAKLVDDLIKDRVEDAFVSRWKTGVPTAQTAAVAYHTARLYIELLTRGTFTHGQLMISVQTIYRVFAKIHDAGDHLKRRFILIPVFLCSIISPEMIQRRQIFERLEDAVGSEATWNKALEVSKTLMREEKHCVDGSVKGFGTISWADIHDKLQGITLF